MAAARTVSNTYELLESILLLLPFHNILDAKAVCKQWQAVTADSSFLQQAIFRHPGRDTPLQLEQNMLAKEEHLKARDAFWYTYPPVQLASFQLNPLFKV